MSIETIRRIGFFSITLGALFSAHAAVSDSNDSNIFVNLSKKIVPSVVNISTMSRVQAPPYLRGAPDDPFRRFFEEFFGYGDEEGGMPDPRQMPPRPGNPGQNRGPKRPPRSLRPPDSGQPRAMSLGTGFIIDASGLILTNNHVVAEADEIKIHFTEETDEKPTDGEVVGRDPELDLALIRVKVPRKMVPLPLGDSDALEVGEYVAAVGNPFGQGHSVTHGIISAKGRKSPDFALANYIQTDAPINPGNSGGPLVNLKGEVIGINNAIDQRAQGIGFAIPINIVKEVLPQLKTRGSVSRGYIGVLVGEMTPDLAQKMSLPKDTIAPFITHVYPGEPAAKAGIKPYDVIVEFHGKKIRDAQDLVAAVTSVPVNQSAVVVVMRGGAKKEFKIKVTQRPGAESMAEKSKAAPQPEKPKASPQAALKDRPEVGLHLEDLNPELARELGLPEKSKGPAIVDVEYEGLADQAGLLRGDVVLEVDRKPMKDSAAFSSAIKGKKSVMVRVRRLDPQGKEFFSVSVLNLP